MFVMAHSRKRNHYSTTCLNKDHIAILYNCALGILPRNICIINVHTKNIVNEIPYPDQFNPVWSDIDYDQNKQKLFILEQPTNETKHKLHFIKNILLSSSAHNHRWIKLHDNVFGSDHHGRPRENWQMMPHAAEIDQRKSLRKLIVTKDGLFIFAAFIVKEDIPECRITKFWYKEQVYIYKYNEMGERKLMIPTKFIIDDYYQQHEVVRLSSNTTCKFLIINETNMDMTELYINGDTANITKETRDCDWEGGVVNCRDNILMGTQKNGLWMNIIDLKKNDECIKKYQIERKKNEYQGDIITILMHDEKWSNELVSACCKYFCNKSGIQVPPQYLIKLMASYYNHEYIVLLINKKTKLLLNIDAFKIQHHFIESILEFAEEC